MYRQRPIRLPWWLKELLKELTKPPYFMQQQFMETSGKTEQEQTSSSSNNGSTRSYTQYTDNASTRAAETVRRDRTPNTSPNTPATAETRTVRRRTSVTRSGNTGAALAQPASALAEKPILIEPERQWRAVLMQSSIPVDVVREYGFEVRAAERVQDIVRIYSKGKTSYALKATRIPAKRVGFMDEALRYAVSQGFTAHTPLVQTTKHRPYVSRQERTYYVTKWVTGNPANFSLTEHVRVAADTLAKFHESTRGFESGDYNPPMEFRLLTLLRRRSEDLRYLIARVSQANPADRFDETFLHLANALQDDANRSIEVLSQPECQSFLNQDEDNPGLCHLDVIPENLIYRGNHDMRLIDFDLMTFAPRVLDLAHLLRRSLQRQNWQSDVAYECFVAYDDVRSMQAGEYQIVHALLTFPYRAWRVAHARYGEFRETFQLEELLDYASQEERRQAFLRALKEQIPRQPE